MERIGIDLRRGIGRVDRRIFGNFIEHLGRCIYGGIFERVRHTQRIAHPIPIAFDEWNVWYRTRSHEDGVGGVEERYNLRRETMPKIKHIALATQDVEKTARFYIEVFGMKEVGKIDDPGTRGCFLTDGDINLAILNFKNDAAAGVERGKDWSGIHHVGFQVESLDAIAERLAQAGSRRREDVEQALGVGDGPPHGNVEVKYTGPDGIMLDVSQTGWIGTPSFGAYRAPARIVRDGAGHNPPVTSKVWPLT